MDERQTTESQQPPTPPSVPNATDAKEKLPAYAHILCGWPLLLVAVGGFIGGGLGGLAYGVNVGIYRSKKIPVIAKVFLNLVVGASAVILWLVIGGFIAYKMK